MSEPLFDRIGAWLLCLFGRHDWDEFGQCRRSWEHVRSEPYDYVLNDGPYDRIFRARHNAKIDAGERLQAEMKALGHDVSLELCMDMAANGLREDLLQTARERGPA